MMNIFKFKSKYSLGVYFIIFASIVLFICEYVEDRELYEKYLSCSENGISYRSFNKLYPNERVWMTDQACRSYNEVKVGD